MRDYVSSYAYIKGFTIAEIDGFNGVIPYGYPNHGWPESYLELVEPKAVRKRNLPEWW